MKKTPLDTKAGIKIANRVSIRTMVLNFILAVVQFVIGLIAGSAALVSSAVHTLSDGATTIIVMIGVNVAGKKSDKSHQYGHERFESVASLIMAVILVIVGIGIGYGAVHDIIGGEYEPMSMEIAALIIAGLTIAIKEWMFWYTRAAAKKINSTALMADAWHSRSDAMATVGAFCGILGARMGFPVLDSVAGLIICVFIVKTAFDIFKTATNQMVDKACDPETLTKLETVISRQEGVMGIDDLRTRMFGSKMYVDIEIAADGELTLNESHKIAENVHDAVETAFSEVKHCMVHVNPAKE
ncbi:MAG: cation diffusion facilitator family transporter [Oscillospiraceae bacterium]|jgi:cation diffusion facilitator family transporter|nr:cation diffusion facilitator family transporter [Oscillospiraceae bacterium]